MSAKHAFLGIGLMVLAVLLFPLKDSFVKLMQGAYAPAQIVWAQMLFSGSVLLAVTVLREGWRAIVPRPLAAQIARGFFVLAGMGTFYWAIQLIPLAEATAMQFVAPLIVTALSPLTLGERIGPRRWLSVLAGFIGVLIVLRPEFSGERLGYFVGLASGILIGFFFIMNRKLAHTSSPIAALAYSASLGALIVTPLVPAVWQPPSPQDLPLIAMFLGVVLVGQICIFASFRFGEASLVAPFHYAQIIGATLFGYVFFKEFPDALSWLGITIIVASGVYIVLREARSARPPR